MENKQPQVVILSMTRDGEKLCAAGGRISTQPGDAIEIWNNSQDEEKNSRLIQKVTRSGHNSVVEHACFHLAFQNVSVMAEQFMIEFRLASFTVKSRRYVDFSSAGYYLPEGLDKTLEEAYTAHMESLFADYQYLVEHDVPKEDARFVLPYCFCSNFYCTLNGRELLHVLTAMLYGRGRRFPELVLLGNQLLEQAREIAPGIFAALDDVQEPVPDTPELRGMTGLPEDAQVMPHGYRFAELLAATPEAAKCVARTALIEGTQLPGDEIDRVLSDAETRAEIIRRVITCSRPRALENISFTFRLNGVSLPCITHIVRHRMQSVMIPALMQTDRTHKIIPPSVRRETECLVRYEAAFRRNAALYQKLRGEGVPEETLVYFLLSGNTLDVVTTMNARELLLFLRLRTCNRAQWEIRIYADEMLRLLREKEPEIFQFFGPSCFVTGKCPEGRLSCGTMQEVREKYQMAENEKKPVENA